MTTKTPKMWAVSRGSYSDYRVLCLLNTEREAKQLVERMRATGDDRYGEPPFVEEFHVTTPDVQRIEVLKMQENLWDDGTESDESQSYWIDWPFDVLYPEDALPVSWRWVRAPIHYNRGGRLEVAGVDHERVRKVFSERKALIKSDASLRGRKEVRG